MRATPLRAALSWSQSDFEALEIHSSDGALRLSFEVSEGTETAEGIEDYISNLEGALDNQSVFLILFNEYIVRCRRSIFWRLRARLCR